MNPGTKGFELRASFLRRLAALALLLLAPLSPIFGDDPASTDVETARARLAEALERERGLSQETKAALQELLLVLGSRCGGDEGSVAPPAGRDEIAQLVDERIEARIPARETPAWEGALDRMHAYGDLRLRQESWEGVDGGPARGRQRARLRLGVDYQLSEDVLVGGRITTGALSDPNSPHATLGNGFSKFAISIDRAFVTYRPEGAGRLWVTAGEFGHPFFQNPVYGELLWDADVQPQGAAGGYTFAGGGAFEALSLTAAEYVLFERNGGDGARASVFGAHARSRWNPLGRIDAALAYYRYSDVNQESSSSLLSGNAGNATLDADGDGQPDAFRSRFGILHFVSAITLDRFRLPLSFSGEYVWNSRARIEEDQGWAAGVAFGKSERAKDVRVYYQWQVVEQDAVFSPFVQDDFVFQTNHRSHLFGTNYQLTDWLGLHTWFLVSRRDQASQGQSEEDVWRFRFDANVKF